MRAAILAACALAALAVPVRGQETHLLQRAPKKGDTERLRYLVVFEGTRPGDAAPTKIEVDLEAVSTTEEASPQLGHTVKTRVAVSLLKLNGTPVQIPERSQEFTSVYDAAGRLKEQKFASEADRNLGSLVLLAQPRYTPDGPLKVGESVKYTSPAGPDGKSATRGTLTLVAVEKPTDEIPVETLRLRDVSETGDASGNGPSVRSAATYLLDPKTGALYRAEGTVTGMQNLPIPGARVTFVVTRGSQRSSRQ